MMSSRAIIVDLDGTLTSCEHRRHFVTGKNKDWKNLLQ
jgi:FMN phosphatase YigB (HAD superfamily)